MKDYVENPDIKYGKISNNLLLRTLWQFFLNITVLGPIMSEAKVKLAPNPDRVDVPFSVPKVLINVVMQELALGMYTGLNIIVSGLVVFTVFLDQGSPMHSSKM